MKWGALGSLLLAACSVEPIDRAFVQTGMATYESGHMTEIVRWDGMLIVADANAALVPLVLEPDGSLTKSDDSVSSGGDLRCTTLAVDEAHGTLTCASEASSTLWTWHRDEWPGSPHRHDGGPQVCAGVRDIAFVGDHAYLACFDDGITRVTLDPDGNPASMLDLGVDANVRFVAAHGDRLLALTSDRGLLLLDSTSADAPIVTELPLEGPALDLEVVGTRALVSAGSSGLHVVRLEGDDLELEVTVQPPGVVASAALDQRRLVAATLTGLVLYELDPGRAEGPPPALAYFPTTGGTLDVGFVDGDLIVSDWVHVRRLRLDLSGESAAVEVPRSAFVPNADEIDLPIRNPASAPISVVIGSRRRELASVELAGGETRVVSLERRRLETERGMARIDVEVPGGAHHTAFVKVDDADDRRPSAGQAWPNVLFTEAGELQSTPIPGTRTRFVFFTTDCTAMWPEMEDAAWLARRGELDDGARLILISDFDSSMSSFSRQWGLDDIPHWAWDAFPPGTTQPDGWPEDDMFYGGLGMPDLPGPNSFPTDYVVDENGIVEAVDKAYYGRDRLEPD